MGEGHSEVGVWESESQGHWMEESHVPLAEVDPPAEEHAKAIGATAVSTVHRDLSRGLSTQTSSTSALDTTWGRQMTKAFSEPPLTAVRAPRAAAWFSLSCGYSLFSIVTGKEVLLYNQQRRPGAEKATAGDMGCAYQCVAYISRPAGSQARALAYLCDGTLTVAAGSSCASGWRCMA
jgi:hypothetical protein